MRAHLRRFVRALGGEIVGGQVLCPGPGHGPRDRSLSVKPSAAASDGFIVFSHAGDDFQTCRDHVRERLGLAREMKPRCPRRPWEARGRPPEQRPQDDDRSEKMAAAVALWRASVDPRETPVDNYLASRGLGLDDELDDVLRWHADTGAMIALFRTIGSNRPQAVSRTFLDREGRKRERKFLGPVGGAAIKLDSDDSVLSGLHIGEGVETCMAARRLGLRPCWTLGSAGAIAAFPVLNGIEALTLLAEGDKASERAVEACALLGTMLGAKSSSIARLEPKTSTTRSGVGRERWQRILHK
jgi:hypothetical protein